MSFMELNINPSSIEAGKKLFPYVHFKELSDLKLPYPGSFFDLLFISSVLKHIRHQDRPLLYKEMKRVSQYVFVIDFYNESNEKETERGDNFSFYHAPFHKELLLYFKLVSIEIKGSDFLGLYLS